jgi:hypothetical protein
VAEKWQKFARNLSAFSDVGVDEGS